jgi:uncharacterized protein (DUF433 family)
MLFAETVLRMFSDNHFQLYRARVSHKKRGNSVCVRWDPQYCLSMKASELVTVHQDILGGTPVFKGTRVPVKSLFEYLENNYTLDEFLGCFPSVTREMIRRVLAQSESALLTAAA